ncbi:hypothetical protein H0H93_014901 [Arthromyces matolae]|nr:hypothetical protein H0H93_014901 [Arthromyces matolae]
MSLSPSLSPTTTPAGLAKLLADAYADADSLRRELVLAKKRADHADRLASSMSALRQLPDQDAAIDILKQWEQRALAAEQAREEAEIKRKAIESSWIQLNSFFSQLDIASQDARAGFSRVFDNGGPLVAPGIPNLGPRGRTFPLPHSTTTTGSRRPRTPSIDAYAHPPSKKSRNDYDSVSSTAYSQPRMILPPPPQPAPHRRPRSHSRDSDRSSSSTTSVGDMIIQASEGQPHPPNGSDPPQFPVPQQHYEHEHEHVRRSYPDYQNVPHEYRSSPKQSGNAIIPTATPAAAPPEPLAQSGQAREFQTHIFAPPVTGAPVKKSKFPQAATTAPTSVSTAPVSTSTSYPEIPQAPPTAAFPATNEQGQRICRQCGMAGRYKDGKCVEKWGPGPMGPGTVCDRCRKKMKRVERRGTLESQQLSSSGSFSHLSRTQSQPHNTLQRTDTLPAISSSSFNHSSSSRSDLRLSALNNDTSRPLRSRSPGPVPSITSLRDTNHHYNDQRGGPSRSNSRNSVRPSVPSTGGRATPLIHGSGDSRKPPSSLKQHNSAPAIVSKRPSPSHSPGSGSVMDVDADGDAEDDPDEVDAAFEGLVALGEEASTTRANNMDVDGARDAEQELLEAVDAAEANSSASSHAGRLKEEI